MSEFTACKQTILHQQVFLNITLVHVDVNKVNLVTHTEVWPKTFNELKIVTITKKRKYSKTVPHLERIVF